MPKKERGIGRRERERKGNKRKTRISKVWQCRIGLLPPLR
jgi:hypothetical protein